MRARTVFTALLPFLATAMTAEAAERHFSFAYDQPHTTAYGYAADVFGAKLKELSKGAMIIDQYPGAQLGQEPQVLQKIRTGDIDFAISSTANAATVTFASTGKELFAGSPADGAPEPPAAGGAK